MVYLEPGQASPFLYQALPTTFDLADKKVLTL